MLRRTIIAVVAILAITGGTATAAKLITGKNVKNGSLTGVDIKNGSLGAKELSAKARASLKGQTGATGATGASGAAGAPGAKGDKGDAGAKGDKGDKGDRGPSNVFGARIPGMKTIDGGSDSREIIGGELDEGFYVLTAKLIVENNHGVDNSKPECVLGIEVGPEELFEILDRVNVTIGTTDDTEETEIVLHGLAEVGTDSSGYLVRCEPTGETYNLTFRERVLTALQVAEMSAAGF